MADCRLIYRSTCSESFLPNEDLKALVQQSAENNRRDGITGLLLLSGDQFLQVLEGPSPAVNRLFRRLCRDERHYDIELIAFEQIGPRYFDDWCMHLVDLFDLSRQPRDLLAQKYGAENGVIDIPERLHEIFALLLDARAICRNRPWDEDRGDSVQVANAADHAPETRPPSTVANLSNDG
jgi:hypothetical protein